MTSSIMIRDSVVFHKTNEITLSRARWLGNFVIDLDPIAILLKKLKTDVSDVKATTQFISDTYANNNIRDYSDSFQALENELGYLEELNDNVMKGFYEINNIHDYSSIPWIN